MWPLNAQQIASIVDGSLSGDASTQVSRVVTDSRQPFRGDELFVGLPGERFDGGRFAQGALSRGARVVLTSRETSVVTEPGQAHVQVDNPLVALQSLAAYRRRAWSGTLVGVTGSNGKTIVKDMLGSLLARHVDAYASPQSWNSQVGVALSVLGIHDDDTVAVIECGISEPGEMARLQAMVRPDVGVLVNIGEAHRQTLVSEERTRAEKMVLFRELTGPLISGDALCVAEFTGRGGVARMPSEGELQAARAQLSPALASVPHLVMDAALAMAAAAECGVPPDAMAGALRDWRPAPMRLEMTSTPGGVLLINDAYTADPLSVGSALAVLANEKREGKSIAVLGGLAGLGAQAERAHADIGAQVVRLGIDRLVGVGQGGRQIVAGALLSGMVPDHTVVADSVQDAALLVDEWARNGDRVLLKASRPEGLEEVARIFFAGFAPTRAFV
ncbi:MAG: UDP-N-acetylmuramoyl-tripeptide--D-alanyl-D-alanine ligase, partial [Myxococcales bacterium]|nr:UDP-N-acetylmuramoyl-tripeptide--D-alanyl-D-alanine ligase [Myxococcales bacterium]